MGVAVTVEVEFRLRVRVASSPMEAISFGDLSDKSFSLLLKEERRFAILEEADSLSVARDSEDGSFPSISSSELRNASFDFLTLLANRDVDFHSCTTNAEEEDDD